MSKFFEIIDISQKPDKDGWYILIDPEDEETGRTFYYMEGDWYYSEDEARINENHDTIDVDGCMWLRPISHLPLSSLTGEPLESNTGYTTADVPGEEGLEEMAEEYWASLPTSEGEVYYMIKDAYIAGALSVRQQGGVDYLVDALRDIDLEADFVDPPSTVKRCGEIARKALTKYYETQKQQS
jgi:hypothetical protein